jgi:hypothetical protein
MRPGTRLQTLLADLSHWLLDRIHGGCDTHDRPVRWRDRDRWFE